MRMTTQEMKKLYEEGRWAKVWLIRAVQADKITTEQYEIITGESYDSTSST